MFWCVQIDCFYSICEDFSAHKWRVPLYHLAPYFDKRIAQNFCYKDRDNIMGDSFCARLESALIVLRVAIMCFLSYLNSSWAKDS